MTTSPGYPRFRFIIAPLFLAGAMMAMFMAYLVSPIMPMLAEEFHTTSTAIGYAATISTGFMGAFMFIASAMVGKLGVKKTYMCVFACYGISCILAATANSVGMFMVARAFSGAGWGMSGSAGAACIFMWYPSKERPALFTTNMLTTSLITMFASSLIVPMVHRMSWRSIYWILCVINVIFLLLWVFVGRDFDIHAEDGKANLKASSQKGAALEGFKLAFRNKELWILTIIMMFYVIGTTVLNYFFPTFLQEVRGLEAAASGTITGIRALASLIGSLIGGTVAVALGRRKPLALAATAGIVGSFILLFSVESVPALTAIMFFNGAMNFMNPALQSAAQDIPNMTAASSAAANSMMYGIGTFLGLFLPSILAALQDSMGLTGAMKTCALTVAMISFAASLFMKERGPKAKGKKEG